jgi:hypothetical protein
MFIGRWACPECAVQWIRLLEKEAPHIDIEVR